MQTYAIALFSYQYYIVKSFADKEWSYECTSNYLKLRNKLHKFYEKIYLLLRHFKIGIVILIQKGKYQPGKDILRICRIYNVLKNMRYPNLLTIVMKTTPVHISSLIWLKPYQSLA